MTDQKSTQQDYSGYAQEETLEVKKKRNSITIGVPKEDFKIETRVPLTPQAVSLLVSHGHKILIESGAGEGSNYSDFEYSEAGGVVINDKSIVYKSEVVAKIAPCTQAEIALLKPNNTIISSLHVATQNIEYFNQLINKKVKALALEYIKTDNEFYPVVYSMSEISGSAAVLTAANCLSKQQAGKGVLLGGVSGITPADVVVLGSGTAALFATRAALGLGASVKVFDYSVYNLISFTQRLGKDIFTSILHPKVLLKALLSADVLIGALGIDEDNMLIITNEMVSKMKKGSVIIDLNQDTGSCIESSIPTTLEKPIFEKYGILHFCLPNIATLFPRTASIALSNVLAPLIIKIGNNGGIAQFCKDDTGIKNGIYIYNGILTNRLVGAKFGLSAKDINLFMAAF